MQTACAAAISKMLQKQPKKDTLTNFGGVCLVFLLQTLKKIVYSLDISIVDLKIFLYMH